VRSRNYYDDSDHYNTAGYTAAAADNDVVGGTVAVEVDDDVADGVGNDSLGAGAKAGEGQVVDHLLWACACCLAAAPWPATSQARGIVECRCPEPARTDIAQLASSRLCDLVVVLRRGLQPHP